MSDLDRLADDLHQAATELPRKARDIVQANALQLRNQWRDNARATGRRHAVHYVKAITHEEIPDPNGITYGVGPDTSMKQGDMSFEYGSSNQPPHLDGTRAAILLEPRFVKDVEALAKDML
ncbi:hypothetical protein ACIHFD_56475 [Nonomuraea sp. NPDC051941]|uniref:hypothetical protein n=1 Tax=Nonomuraea sp. NPDC051941 TaxID=3364373 RepID=UPI0037C8507E